MDITLSFRSFKNTLVALGVLASVSTSALASYSEVVFFGDSLTDTGNLYSAVNIPVSPPYNSGRFSNGLLWSEILAAQLGSPASAKASQLGGNNYAWAGATVIDYGRMQPEVPQQLGQYLLKTKGVADPSALYVIMGGANDINEAGKNMATAAGNIMSAAASINAMVNALYASGARNILVGNIPDIGLTPLAIANHAAAGATQLSTLFNTTLDSLLAATRKADVGLDLDTFDLFSLLTDAVANPKTYGFANVTDACKTGDLGAPGSVCSAPESYLFWDAFHPSSTGHQLMAQAALNAIPEPSTLVLLAAALLILFSISRTRRAEKPAL